MNPYLKLAYLFILFSFMMLHIAIVSIVNLGYIVYDPLLLTMPGLIVGMLYVLGEFTEYYIHNFRDLVLVDQDNL